MEDKPLMIDGLDGYQFEELVAKIMKKKGYKDIKVTSKSRDVGKDIIMKNQKGEIILVECKHQNFVGRPVIQKLQGAMSHEGDLHQSKEVMGIVVTSGNFSREAIDYNKEIKQKIELIDGAKLKKLCNELNVVILNGKVQIITNESFRNIDKESAEDLAKRGYSKIYWSKEQSPIIKSELELSPACFIKYNVNFDTHTSVGCIDTYSNSGGLAMDGITGEDLDKDATEFFFSGKIDPEEIEKQDEKDKIQFEFTENDIEEHAINEIIKEHTHNVNYTGNNNVGYSKTCIPKKRDIDIKQFIPIYLPIWINEINIQKQKYKQEFYIKGNNQFYIEDTLRKCKICEKEEDNYEDMSICPDCGRIVCHNHVKIDYLDKETPICEIHAKPLKLWIQNKYFAKKENLNEYNELWNHMGFFKKLYEDKIALGLSIGGGLFLLFILLMIIAAH